MAGGDDVGLPEGQGAAGGHRQLQPHEVEAGHQLGHAVLDLEPGVHLEEVEAARVDQELDRTDAHVVDGTRCRHGRVPHLAAGRGGHEHGRRLLDHLLVPALHRALAVEQVQHVALAVADDLDLDVARRSEVALQEHVVRAERGGSLPPCRGDGLFELVRLVHQAHPPAPSTGRGLDQEREADARTAARSASGDAPASTTALGSTGTPAAATTSFARALWPMTRIASGGGPTHTMPASAHASGSAGFSDRKP